MQAPVAVVGGRLLLHQNHALGNVPWFATFCSWWSQEVQNEQQFETDKQLLTKNVPPSVTKAVDSQTQKVCVCVIVLLPVILFGWALIP